MKVRHLPPLVAWGLLVLGAATALGGSGRSHSAGGPEPSHTGAVALGGSEAEGNCTVCHQDFGNPCFPDPCNLNTPGGRVEILDLPVDYLPGQTYSLRVRLQSDSTITSPDRLWGFQMTSVRASDGAGVGAWVLPDPDTLQVVMGNFPFETRAYVEHRYAGTRMGLSSPIEWKMDWTAPNQNEGTIHFFVAGNATNGDGSPGPGDFVYTNRDSVPVSETPARRIAWGDLKHRYR